MKYISEGLVYLTCCIIIVVPFVVMVKLNSGENFMKHVEQAQAHVAFYESGVIGVEFDRSVVNQCGDTQIFSYITTPDNFALQLKPTFIPEDKANAFKSDDGQVLIFPVFDILIFLQDEGVYTIEMFIKNTCGFTDSAVTLKPFPLLIGGKDG